MWQKTGQKPRNIKEMADVIHNMKIKISQYDKGTIKEVNHKWQKSQIKGYLPKIKPFLQIVAWTISLLHCTINMFRYLESFQVPI